jgi:ABC-2 type transport system ATP-binding protein
VHDAAGALVALPWPDVVGSTGAREFTLVLGGVGTEGQGLLLDGRPATGGAGVATLLAPAGGLPAALTSLPGLGPVGQLAGLAGFATIVDVPGQHVSFTSRPVETASLLLGPATLTLDIAAETGRAQLFVRLSTVAPGGLTTIIGSSFAPVRLESVARDPAAPTRVGITLPDVVHRLEPGERLRLTIATTDQAYANLREPGTVQVGVAQAHLSLRGPDLGPAPSDVAGDSGSSIASRAGFVAVWDQAPVVVVLVLAIVSGSLVMTVVGRIRGRRRAPLAAVAERLAAAAAGPPPVVVRGLVKEYADGTRAVDGLDLTVEAGQVV